MNGFTGLVGRLGAGADDFPYCLSAGKVVVRERSMLTQIGAGVLEVAVQIISPHSTSEVWLVDCVVHVMKSDR